MSTEGSVGGVRGRRQRALPQTRPLWAGTHIGVATGGTFDGNGSHASGNETSDRRGHRQAVPGLPQQAPSAGLGSSERSGATGAPSQQERAVSGPYEQTPRGQAATCVKHRAKVAENDSHSARRNMIKLLVNY